jgi:DNA-directed RNA polymerase specialized sigma24 family protein
VSGPPPSTTRTEDDAEIVAQSLEQPELFALLYDRYAPDIHRYATRRLGDSAADDITADTFLVAFRIRSRYDLTRPNARPWLYGIAGNLIGKQRRTEGRWPAPGRTRSPRPGASTGSRTPTAGSRRRARWPAPSRR